MPLFISDEELDRVKLAGDIPAVVEKAETYIRDVLGSLETVKAEADVAAITAEQTCSILEHKYLSLSAEFSGLEARNLELDRSLQQERSDGALVRAEKHQLHLRFIEKDGEIERLKTELAELQKSKRQLVEMAGLKDTETNEKNSTIKSYLDKIGDLADRAAQREARLSELEAELMRCRANCDKLSQEKELIEKHNAWLNDELTKKVDSLFEQRSRNAEIEADMSAKLSDMEKQYTVCSSSLSRHKERVSELESKVESLQRELCSARDDASATEQQYSAEISTVSKLVDLYKESSEEWSKKAGALEGVIKALETHLSQLESDYKDKLEKEAAVRKEAEKESAELKDKLAKCEAELESSRRAGMLDILPLGSLTAEALTCNASNDDIVAGDHNALVPHVPAGVSGTALAASLLREGWSLAKMYSKYQEAADAARHEQMGRKQTQAILERVLLEIEAKASVILDERAEHDRMAEAYALMNEKLQQSLSEQGNLEKVIREMRAELKRHEREYNYAQKEITDLQKQVTILLKECRDVQLRCGSMNQEYMDDGIPASFTETDNESDTQKVISEHLVSVKDIKGLVEQNVKLRSLVRSLSDEVENRDLQLKEQLEEELQKHKEDAASRVGAVLERAEEQGRMIESLHSSVAMYRRLYEEEHRLRSSQPQTAAEPSGGGRKDFMLLLEGSQEATKKVQEQASERVRCLEDELTSRNSEIISLRSERDKLAMEANFMQEKLGGFMKEFDHQREELNRLLARNIEFSQLIVDYQKKLRESSESVHKAEELSRKLNTELSVLKREKELLLNSEKRAHDEVQGLSERVYRLQAALDTIQSAEQVREEARAAEKKKQEEHIKQIEREWAEAKNELQDERSNVRSLSLDREHITKDAMRQVEYMRKESAAALQAVAAAEARAAVAEARYTDLERILKSSEAKVGERDGQLKSSSASGGDVTGDLKVAEQEIARLKAESEANKKHMVQYKGIAEVNEAALKHMESAYEKFRIESEKLKESLEAEIQSLRDQVHELENETSLKFKEAASAATEKDEALACALAEVRSLKEETSSKVSQIMSMEVQVTVLKDELERAHERAHSAQANYERQVILQSETIQELTKTSQALASVQEEASALRRMVDTYKSENTELKSKWDIEKSALEMSKSEAEKKYEELNEQNKTLHSRLESIHIRLAEKDRDASGVASGSTSGDSQADAGVQSVISYLRRSREIAETEISLLKQEKLRLQSQLDRASKAAEEAEATLKAERASSRSLVFTDDEFKALKLQVSEMNLLRESNMQLREENKYNFEECQKLREVAHKVKAEAENLQNTLKQRELEVEGLRNEIQLLRKEKEHLDKQISDMLEASKNVDFEDYKRLKTEVEQLQACTREKDALIEETKNLVSQKEELVRKLEQDLASTRLELNERDSRLSQAEKLKSDVEKQKKAVMTYRRKIDTLLMEKESLSKEKEAILKEKDSLSNERGSLGKEKDSLAKEKEVLEREKEELSKEKHALCKQLEDLRQEKKVSTDTSVDPAMKEKENVKDARIQILENTVGRLRHDNKKKEEKRQNVEKVISEKVKSLDMEKQKFEDERAKHKEALSRISDELEKLKHARDSLPVGTSVVQLLSGSKLDDLASAYALALENFERAAQMVLTNVTNQGSASTSVLSDPASALTTTQVTQVEVPSSIPSTASVSCAPPKAIDDREKKVSLPRTIAESRKGGRRLVRPRLLKSEEPQRDADMSELDGSKNSGKPSSGQDMAVQAGAPVSSEQPTQKRAASPSPSELQEGSLQPGDPTTDFLEPAVKRVKRLEPPPEDVQAQSAGPDFVETIPTVEELLDAVAEVPQGSTEEASDFGKELFETFQGQLKEPGESQQPKDAKTVEVPRDNIVDGENAGTSEPEAVLDESSNLHADQDVQQSMIDASDREEGEMIPENSDFDGGDDMIIVENQDATDVEHEHPTAVTIRSPAQTDDDPLATGIVDINEMNSHEIEQMEEGELAEDVEVSDKSNDGNETVGDADHTSEAGSGAAEGNMSAVESASEVNSNILSSQEAQPSHVRSSSRTINLSERAKERALERMGGRSSPAPVSTPTTAARRGRAGPLTRTRGRGTRGGRRPTSSDQG